MQTSQKFELLWNHANDQKLTEIFNIPALQLSGPLFLVVETSFPGMINIWFSRSNQNLRSNNLIYTSWLCYVLKYDGWPAYLYCLAHTDIQLVQISKEIYHKKPNYSQLQSRESKIGFDINPKSKTIASHFMIRTSESLKSEVATWRAIFAT